MDMPNTKRGSTLIIVLAIALLILLTVGTAAIVFTNVFDNIFTQRKAAREGQGLLERAQESYEEFQKEKDAMLKGFSPKEAEDEEPSAPNAPFPQNPDEPLSNPLDAEGAEDADEGSTDAGSITVPEPVLDPRHEDSIELVKPPDLVTCPKEGSRLWVKKYVGDYIYCVVPERPCIYASCTFSRYFLDGTVDIYGGKCQDDEYINPKSSAPLCSELGI